MQPDAVIEAAAFIRSGALVAFPTDTLYGVGADAFSAAAIANLIATYGDDLWAIENHLYEIFQKLTQVGEVTIRHPTAGMKIKKQLNTLITLFDGKF